MMKPQFVRITKSTPRGKAGHRSLAETVSLVNAFMRKVSDPLSLPNWDFRLHGWRIAMALLMRAQDLPKFGAPPYIRMVRRLTIQDAWTVRKTWRHFRQGTWKRTPSGGYIRRSR